MSERVELIVVKAGEERITFFHSYNLGEWLKERIEIFSKEGRMQESIIDGIFLTEMSMEEVEFLDSPEDEYTDEQ